PRSTPFPTRRSSDLEIMEPVKNNSQALALPTRRGKNQLPPQSGCKPIRAKLAPNAALSEAIRMSQPSAKLKPAPAQGPLTAAIRSEERRVGKEGRCE